MVNVKHNIITLVRNLLFWLFYCLFMAGVIGVNSNQSYWFVLTHYLSGIPAFALFAYGTIRFVLPQIINKQANYLNIAIFVTLMSATAAFLSLVLQHFVFYGVFWPASLAPEKWFSLNLLLQSLLPIWIPAIILTSKSFVSEWFKETKAKGELEKENLETELKMLKNQLNPHFLFNTLNNLYSLALMKSDKTPEMIARLSDMFQYILYECNATTIPLKKELNLINNYVKLQQLRYGERLEFSIQSDVGIENFKIAPMVLLTFVENCFKHGSGSDPGIPWIKLSFERKADKLLFKAENSKPRNTQNNQNTKGGIGLNNMEKRLKLMYSGHYVLNVQDEDTTYAVELLLDELENPASTVLSKQGA